MTAPTGYQVIGTGMEAGDAAADANRFDTALQSYIAANAHQVATSADFAHAFADVPQVLDLLAKAGAQCHVA